MSFIKTHGKQEVGITVGYHIGYANDRWDLDYRAHERAIHVIGRDKFGSWKLDRNTYGDIFGLMFIQKNTRIIPGHRWAWPLITSGGSGGTPTGECGPAGGSFADTPTQGGTGGAGGGKCKKTEQFNATPVWQSGMQEDGRFSSISPETPAGSGGVKVWPKFPKGYYGIGVTGDDENEQINYFMPTDPRLIAVNREGDPAMGTNVVDMAPGFEIDPFRHARLQSNMRVIRGPESEWVDYHERNSLAWNITDTGCEDSRGGLWIDRPVYTFTGKPRVVAAVSQNEDGPFVAGELKDKHRLGDDADGNPLHSGHLSLLSYFWFSPEEDAPLQYDGPFSYKRSFKPPTHTPGTHFTDVWFEYDKEMSHSHVSGMKKGRFKWRAATIIHIPSEGKCPKPDPKTEEDPREEPRNFPPPFPPEATEGGLSEFEGGLEDGIDGGLPSGLPFGFLLGPAIQTGVKRKKFSATVMDFSSPALLGRPQMMKSTYHPDLRSGAPGANEEALGRHDDDTPVTGRLESFGVTLNGEWGYTQEPCRARYRGGTASGGWVLMAPEVDMADWEAVTIEAGGPA